MSGQCTMLNTMYPLKYVAGEQCKMYLDILCTNNNNL